jgi:hypothetical protein
MSASMWLRNALITLAAAGAAVYLAHHSPSVHLPFLAVVLGSGLLGYFDPKTGWASVLLLSALVVGARAVLRLPATDVSTADFASYVAPFPALFGGLLGRLSRKAF